MKKLKKIAIIIAVILLVLILIGVINKAGSDSALENLKAAPVSALSATGELAEIFAFGTDYTDIQRENKLREIKGSVVMWQLPVFEVKRDGENYRVLTQNPKGFGNDEAMVPTIITLTPLSEEDKSHIEALKTGDMISFKGSIYDAKARHLLIKPAYLYAASTPNATPQANVATESVEETASTTGAESDVNASLAKSTDQLNQVEEASANWKPSFDCSKAATPVEKMICSDPLLGKLDGVLTDNYKTIKSANIGDGALADLKSTQKQWIETRNKCTDNQCLEESYKARIDQVCEYPVISGVHPGCISADEVN